MARGGMTLQQLVEATGLNERTVKAVLYGKNKPHARTLHRLAAGLGVSADELFQNPSLLTHRLFDRRTNPIVQEVVSSHPELFAGWGEPDFPLSYQRISSVPNIGATLDIKTLLYETGASLFPESNWSLTPSAIFKYGTAPGNFSPTCACAAAQALSNADTS
jgi:transcriptional regulator with XRE-family HTH domain